MNKFFIGLLIIAIGAGGYYFFLRKKDKPVAGNELSKQLILGKWKIDLDSVQHYYEFQKDGNLLETNNDSANPDTTRYEWFGENQIRWTGKKEEAGDTLVFIVTTLKTDSLVLQSKDSVEFYFTKIK